MSLLKIGVVGPCAAGKSTLIQGLNAAGYYGKHIAQEHSGVPDMWKRLTSPNILIYLDVSYQTTIQRKNLNWTYKEYQEQIFRLRHAREHSDLVIFTDPLSPDEVLRITLNYIMRAK